MRHFSFSILAMILSSASHAQAPSAAPSSAAPRNAITLYGGYRAGGSFSEQDTGNTIDVKDSGAASLAVDIGIDPQRQVQIFLSHQSTHMDFSKVAAPKSSALGESRLPLTVDYLHVGGTYFYEGTIGTGPYVVGGIGASIFQLDGPGYGQEVFPSINLGLGYQWMFARHLAVRLEGRVYGNLLKGSGGMFCSGGCVVSIQGNSLGQAEALLGISLPF
ncbi:hypothetical protein VVD49_02420 [Uliginosibacterium sp. H3]|uniref:Outer membrane protein beta-barrel domain-containing protein n=1 Tax=Uliginosibacterium silvisoli TaxID=3114758 RepID=A0ABU6JYS3_9RHOO|nr:hypothetical protein [Uliginosibacterium sp. H3]